MCVYLTAAGPSLPHRWLSLGPEGLMRLAQHEAHHPSAAGSKARVLSFINTTALATIWTCSILRQSRYRSELPADAQHSMRLLPLRGSDVVDFATAPSVGC